MIRSIDDLRIFLIDSFPHSRIYLFGSRAKNTHTPYSDVDIAIESQQPIKHRLVIAKEQIENSLLPFKVDLVDLSNAPYLKQTIQKEGIVWH